MLYVKNDSKDPYFNLAFEEYILKNICDEKNEFILLWQNKPTVVIGKNQNTLEEINYDYIKKNAICVVRRLSGGGAVYHDLGNLNYTFITKADKGSETNFIKFTRPVIEALKSLGVPAEFSGRNDITIEGKKFSGNAQYFHQGKMFHHGTLLFNSNLEEVKNALKVDKEKIESKGIKSIRSRVTNISDYLQDKITIEKFKEILLQKIFAYEGVPFKEYKLTKKDIENIKKIMQERYLSWEWNFGLSPDFNLKNALRFKVGKIEVLLNIKKGEIFNCKFYGDFFGVENVTTLENKLKNKKYKEAEIRSLLDEIDITRYFGDITKEDFMKLLF